MENARENMASTYPAVNSLMAGCSCCLAGAMLPEWQSVAKVQLLYASPITYALVSLTSLFNVAKVIENHVTKENMNCRIDVFTSCIFDICIFDICSFRAKSSCPATSKHHLKRIILIFRLSSTLMDTHMQLSLICGGLELAGRIFGAVHPSRYRDELNESWLRTRG